MQASSGSSDEDPNFDANATDEEIDEDLAFNDGDEEQYGDWFDSHNAQHADGASDADLDAGADSDGDAAIAAYNAAAATAQARARGAAAVQGAADGGMLEDSDAEAAAQRWLEGPDAETSGALCQTGRAPAAFRTCSACRSQAAAHRVA